jgi:hypothetical protein
MPVESLILRRCYPVPVTMTDLKRAHEILMAKRSGLCSHVAFIFSQMRTIGGVDWVAAIKDATGAIDEVYAVIDGREVRVAIVQSQGTACELVGEVRMQDLHTLLIKADEQGYWERPHEVVHVLEERAISRRAVNLTCGVSPDKVSV